MDGSIWIPLLRELSSRHEDFVVWKHLDRCLAGIGDVDARARPESLHAITSTIVQGAFTHLDAEAVITCEHVPGKRLHFLVTETSWPALLEVDVGVSASRLGASFAPIQAVLAHSEIDANGIRRSSKAAEAVVTITFHSTSWTGRRTPTRTDRELVQAAIESDPTSVHRAIDALTPLCARIGLHRLVRGIQKGSWDAAASRAGAVGFAVSAALQPRHLLSRSWALAQHRVRGSCIMGTLVHTHRRRAPFARPGDLISAAQATGHRAYSERPPRESP